MQSMQLSHPADRCSYKIVVDQKFEWFINAAIILNTLALASVYDGMSDRHSDILDISEVVFTVIFGVEALLKLTGFKLQGYFCGPRYGSTVIM